ncbi:dapper homolog 2 [Ochotona princeps]|uniref:dapper homolog 2 n=1 Tax=Ochotona princeps TaxID=9978 RepID=UPI0027152D2C|nr:dapper homolog 2 [Ochotona princeps]
MWAPGGPPGPAGWDRRRVGARLRAALAGLHELQGLRATQQARVRDALAMQPSARPAAPGGPRGPELRLEAALAALQEQLSQLRRQDTGLKTHLEQLGQQISELQLGMCRSSSEAVDSDSRPSSGFYELSDGASCSLSTSCASVCSDHVSPSLGSLLPAIQISKDRPAMGDWRPRSADETTVPVWRPQPTEEVSGLPGSTEDAVRLPRGTFRPRPVSTGDLDRVLQDSNKGHCQGAELLCQVLDPKYQRDLVSRGGREVYPYPSPLHAVALQSPLFALTKEALPLAHPMPPAQPVPCTPKTGQAPEVGPAGAYIHRLLYLHGQRASPGAGARSQEPPRLDACPSPQKLGQDHRPSSMAGTPSRDGPRRQGLGPFGDAQHPCHLPKNDPGPKDGCVPGEMTGGPLPSSQAPQPPRALDGHQGQGSSPARRLQELRPLASGHLIPKLGVEGRASLQALTTSHPKPKAVKGRRRACDKGPSSRKLPLPPERLCSVPGACHPAAACDPSRVLLGAGLRGTPTLAAEARGRSCSESTLYPVSFLVPLVVAPRASYPAPAQGLFPLESRKKPRRWRSTAEVSGWRAAGVGLRLEPGKACAQAVSQPPERPAQCASLPSSTVAHSSEDDASARSASCFGDSESSGSDTTEGSARRSTGLDSTRPGQGMRTPGGARPSLPPVPHLCRVRASRALKKKIRRFQPAALKVMTMV